MSPLRLSRCLAYHELETENEVHVRAFRVLSFDEWRVKARISMS